MIIKTNGSETCGQKLHSKTHALITVSYLGNY